MFGPEYLPIYIGAIILLLILMTVQAAEGKYSHNMRPKTPAASKSGFTCPPERDYVATTDYMTRRQQGWL